nr:GntR family transcriptional regulator [Halobacillus andaensis]
MPMYYQIEENVKQRIANEEFKRGEAIPSERELSESYEVSRMTVRQAITNLVNEGILYRRKGRGTFVAEEKIAQPLQGMTSFTEDMKSRGMKPESRLLSLQIKTAPAEISQKLHLESSSQVVKIDRIRYADQEPMAIETTYLSVRKFPDLTEDIVKKSLYDYIEKDKGYTIEKATQMIEAVIAGEKQADLLGVEAGQALLHIERNSYLSDGSPFEVVISDYRADRYKFITDMFRG